MEFDPNDSLRRVEGIFRPSSQADIEVPVSLKSFWRTSRPIGVATEIRNNAIDVIDAGYIHTVLYAEPILLTVDELVAYTQTSNNMFNHPAIFEAFDKIILQVSDGLIELTRNSDGFVEVTQNGVVFR